MSTAVYSEGNQISLTDLISGETRSLDLTDSNFMEIFNPQWSPDGSSIAFAATSISIVDDSVIVEEFPSIYILHLEDNIISKVTSWETVEVFPSWSPVGSQIVFASDHEKVDEIGDQAIGDTDLFLLTAKNSSFEEGEIEQLTNYGMNGNAGMPAWSPNGESLVFRCGIRQFDKESGSEKYQDDICILDLSSGITSNVSNTHEKWEQGPVWSPDGSMIGFSQRSYSDEHGSNFDVMIFYVNEDRLENITDTLARDEVFSNWLNWP